MLSILLLAFLLFAQDKPADKCAVSGTVTDSATGAALSKAEVFLESTEAPRGPFVVANADAKGKFSLAGIDPGKYRIRGVRNGYLDTYYGARRGDSTGIPVALEAGQELKDLQLKLLPYAVIAGTIRDADGEPVAGAQVNVCRLIYSNGRRELDDHEEIVSDDLGQYRAANLVPGKYYVEARPRHTFEPTVPPADRSAKNSPPREILLAAYYPGARDMAAATAVPVSPGARVTGIDIVLARSRVFHVSGHINGPPGVNSLRIGPADSSGLNQVAWVEAPNGDFELREVPPGPYVFSAGARVDETSWVGEATVTVGAADVTGLRISLVRSPAVSGRVVVEGKDKASLGMAWLRFGPERAIHVHDDGGIDSASAPPGHYSIGLANAHLQHELVIKSIRMGEIDVLRDGLTLNAGDDARLEIVLAPDGGVIDGTVLDKDDNPVAGATVIAVPELSLRARTDRFYEAATDQYGRYQLKNVAPGDYKLFAWDDVEQGVWFDPDFLREVEARGEPVKLNAKGHESARLHVK